MTRTEEVVLAEGIELRQQVRQQDRHLAEGELHGVLSCDVEIIGELRRVGDGRCMHSLTLDRRKTRPLDRTLL
jgi:hypothetical protein